MEKFQFDADKLIAHARVLTNLGSSDEAISILQDILSKEKAHAEAHYLLAFNLHVYQKDFPRAFDEYHLALKSGFDEFWVRYNLGSMLLQMSRYNDAYRELDKACRIKPEHAGVNQVMRKVQLFRSKDDRKTDNNKILLNPSIVKAAETIQNNIFQKSVMIDDFELFIPPSLKRFQPLSPYNFEEELYQGLKMVLKPAMVVFEAGSYCGVLTSLINKMVGDEGQVHLFEASFDSIERARQMVFHNHLKNVQFMNVFLAAESGSEHDFYVIRSSDGWAVSSADAGIVLLYPEAQNIKVSALSLDDYCRENDVIPDVIKMDIEGAEYAALSGANHILSHYAPDIILEVHGDRMPGISGNTAMLMRLLSDDGYRFFDLESGVLMTAGQYSQEYPIYGHVLCSVKDMTTHQFLQRSDVLRNQRVQREILLDQRKKARELVDQGQFRQALEILKELCHKIPEDADLYYLTAFCHHHLGENFPQVLKDYQKAFELGFDEFWIRYNRANLFYQMKDLDSALNELEIAVRLYPEHEGARSLWQILSKKA